MRKLSLVSATAAEIEPTLVYLHQNGKQQAAGFELGNLLVTPVICGVGMVATAFVLGKMGQHKIDLAINVGVAGSFNKFNIGTVVKVNQDCFSELGAQDDEKFLSIDAMGFGSQIIRPEKQIITPALDLLPVAKAITVNTVHGHVPSIKKITDLFHPDIESMEGAAFFYAANANQWECLQLRAISNQVEKRDKAKWDLQGAVKNLNEKLIKILAEISVNN